jgi:hypothetical protein
MNLQQYAKTNLPEHDFS